MKIQFLHTLDCQWCVKTKKLLKESLGELKINKNFEEIIIDSEEKAQKYKFVGSPTIRVNEKDIQEDISKERCLPCEKLIAHKEVTAFVKQECGCGCRIYFYKGKQYPYPPKGLIKESIVVLGKENGKSKKINS